MFKEKPAVCTCEGSSTVSGSKSTKYTSKQLKTIILFGLANIFSGTIVAIQAPFYPKEAESKGATATEYGLVMGVFQLTMFIMASVYGSILGYVNLRILYNLGMFVTAVSAIVFGLLDYVDDHLTFIILSFILRIVQASGDAGFVTVSFAIIVMEFPDSVATTFATFSTCFAVGLVIGPGVGGVLYELGGFILPFLTMGLALVIVSILTYFLLPKLGRPCDDSKMDTSVMMQNKAGFFSMIRIPVVALAFFSASIAACSSGFLAATLEPHLRENFGLSPGVTGLMFIIDGSAYALTSPFWGRLVDKSSQPLFFTLLGSLLTFTGFLFIGPAPFIPLNTILWLTCIGLVIHGFGLGASSVSAFIQAMRGAVNNGFNDDVSTYGLVSGLWMSSYAFGSFVGPSIGGILLDYFGFKISSIFVLSTQMIVVFLSSCLMSLPSVMRTSRSRVETTCIDEENQTLINHDDAIFPSCSKDKAKLYEYGAT